MSLKQKLQIYYTFIFFICNISILFGKDIDGDMDVNGPEPIVPHTSYNEPATVSLGNCTGCTCREIPHLMSVFYGKKCTQFPSNVPIKTNILKFRNTQIKFIGRNDFRMLSNLSYIEIESNEVLEYFEPGCFRNMSQLTNLSISFNDKVTNFDYNVFEGLVNLKEIYLRNNGIVRILDVTKALSTKFVPKLKILALNRNALKSINKYDFQPMEGSTLADLNMILCQIDYIHPEALKPLVNLIALRLGENLFTVKTITNLIRTTINYGIQLEILNLYEIGLRGNPPKQLMEVVSKSNISYLNLGRNHIEHLTDDSFPAMPNLITLVLRDLVTVDISNNTFRRMPKLKYLRLNENRLTFIPQGVIIKTLLLLDISSNSYTSDIPFGIPNEIFTEMTNLKKLVLSFNQIEVLYSLTFVGLNNLEVLELNNANLNTINIGTFVHLKNLRRLNLENNYIGTDITLTNELFQGLDRLEVLLLGGCHINNLTSNPSVFKNLPKLNYLGLERNGIHTIFANHFQNLLLLKTIDLSENSLTPWNEQVFPDIKIENIDLCQNKLTTITPTMIKDFQHLNSWNIEENPFICDCNWSPILESIQNSTLDSDHFNANCVLPEPWRGIALQDYLIYLQNNINECQNNAITSKVLLNTFLTAFTLLTAISAIICYYYRWNIRYWIFLARKEIHRKRKHIKLRPKIAYKEIEYKYDSFVSYSNEDKQFVCTLIDELENYYPYLKLCVYERDFQIGTVISENVAKNIAASKRIILVVSESFAKSQWCRFEMYLAECHQLQIDCEDGLILIKIGKISNKYMTPFLKYLMKSRIYLDWELEKKKEKLLWDKLRSTLSAPR